MNLMIIYYNLHVNSLQLAQNEDLFTQDAISICIALCRFRIQYQTPQENNVLQFDDLGI